ncbi:peptidase inhibitor family I36 protein [uncultured Microbacterium sp.]|uniref:peptidase inhibitor family I36 protein n=1 Tax=uncultured Microbacterium sp. TaxID=191216 RepID=UPI002616E9E9|nr:peptidase inhibitor family I36 protein [uncultured Microbacterium sp.]
MKKRGFSNIRRERSTGFLARLTAITVAVAAVGFVGVGVASAAMPSDCSAGRVCVYNDENFFNQIGWRSEAFVTQNISSTNNDKMTSWANNTATRGCWWTGSNGSGTKRFLYANSTNAKVDLNDTMSSWTGMC